MPSAVEAALREELRRASLPGHGPVARLLALLRQAPETHLSLSDVVRMAAEAGIAASQADLASQLQTLADLGLIGRLPSIGAEPVYDTVPEGHSHLVYEDTSQIIDLHVSAETLLAILRQTLAERPDGVEVLVRVRGNRAPPAARRRD